MKGRGLRLAGEEPVTQCSTLRPHYPLVTQQTASLQASAQWLPSEWKADAENLLIITLLWTPSKANREWADQMPCGFISVMRDFWIMIQHTQCTRVHLAEQGSTKPESSDSGANKHS